MASAGLALGPAAAARLREPRGERGLVLAVDSAVAALVPLECDAAAAACASRIGAAAPGGVRVAGVYATAETAGSAPAGTQVAACLNKLAAAIAPALDNEQHALRLYLLRGDEHEHAACCALDFSPPAVLPTGGPEEILVTEMDAVSGDLPRMVKSTIPVHVDLPCPAAHSRSAWDVVSKALGDILAQVELDKTQLTARENGVPLDGVKEDVHEVDILFPFPTELVHGRLVPGRAEPLPLELHAEIQCLSYWTRASCAPDAVLAYLFADLRKSLAERLQALRDSVPTQESDRTEAGRGQQLAQSLFDGGVSVGTPRRVAVRLAAVPGVAADVDLLCSVYLLPWEPISAASTRLATAFGVKTEIGGAAILELEAAHHVERLSSPWLSILPVPIWSVIALLSAAIAMIVSALGTVPNFNLVSDW